MTGDAALAPVLTLLVDGRPLTPVSHAAGVFVFHLALPANEIRLVSGAARPVDLSYGPAVRWHGVFVRGIRFRQGEATSDVPFARILLAEGFYPATQDGLWTNGNALLPDGLVPLWEGEVELVVEIDGRMKRTSFSTNKPPPPHPVLSAFESLGEDCELAFAQKHFDTRIPPGLLSWARIEYHQLLEGLRNDFEGVDDPSTSTLVWRETGPDRGEYRLCTRFFRAHTGQNWKSDPVELAEMLRMYCARVRFLRKKLLRDLAAPRRIWVFVDREGDTTTDRIVELYAALRRHGPADLLYVAAGTAGACGPWVTRLDEGIYLARFGELAGGRGPYQDWLETCRQTLQIARDQPTSA